MLLSNQWISGWIKEETLKIHRDKWKQTDTKSMGHSKSASKREVHSKTGQPLETGSISNKQSHLTNEGTRKRDKAPRQ